MSGSKSPDVPPLLSSDTQAVEPALNGRRSPQDGRKAEASRDQNHSPNATDAPATTSAPTTNGTQDEGDSEAETLIDSPVKRKEATRRDQTSRAEKPAKSRIGSLPVPGEDDESDSHESPVESVELDGEREIQKKAADPEAMDVDSEKDNESASTGSLSSPQSPTSNNRSRTSSRSRAFSERPETSRAGADSPNPRKRKYRASSVNLPNKRASKGSVKRSTLGAPSEEGAAGEDIPDSPKLRSHRRAVSTQSAAFDVAASDETLRKRRKKATRETKSGRNGWEESDASSEATSHGNIEAKRPQRGVGRSTSTPGRPTVREHKRHVNKYGFTRLAEACEAGDLEAVKEWRERDPDQLELAEFAQNKPLQIAALNGNDEVVAYLIEQGCQIDCANVDKDTPLIDAAENGHLDVVKILLHAGVDPLRQNLKGQQALDVVTEDTDDADEIRAELRRAIESWNSDESKQRREEEEVQRHQAGTHKGLHFMARSYENLLKLVTVNDRSGVREFLDARVPVDNAIVAAAAKTGDLYLVNMLLAEMTEKKAHQKAEKPMMAVLGTSHFDMVKALTELDRFDPLWRTRQNKTWPELAEERNGPNAKQEKELLQRLYDNAQSTSTRRSSSPIVKRETGKRRHTARSMEDDNDGSDGEDQAAAPKRKNGRRLMSRRDMRAVNGKNVSESESDEDSTSDADSSAEQTPTAKIIGEKSQLSPASRRGGRGKANSMSSNTADRSPASRRRSSILPSTNGDAEGTSEGPAIIKKEGSTNHLADAAADQAASLKAKADAELETQKAEEEARKLREEELRREAQQREEEEEEARKQREREDARQKLRERVLASFPPPLRRVLDPTSDFHFEGEEALDYLLVNFTPLLLIRERSDDVEDDAWIVNAQAAPLLGKRGLELLMPEDETADDQGKTFSRSWTTYSNFSEREQKHVTRTLKDLCEDKSICNIMDEEEAAKPFMQRMQEAADRYNAVKSDRKKLLESPAAIQCVRLADVLRHLDPVLKDVPIQVEWLDWPLQSAETAKMLDIRGITGFVDRIIHGHSTMHRPQVRTVNQAEGADKDQQRLDEVHGFATVCVVEQK